MMRGSVLSAFMATFMSMTACACNSGSTEETTPAAQQNGGGEQGKEAKSLVVYFSCTGNTKAAADKIAAVLGCDEWRIEPVQPYTSADLDWTDEGSRSSKENGDATARPAIDGDMDLSNYDTIYVGYPIWWGVMPKIMWTFFESHDFTGKTIVPFCTSGGSDITPSVDEIKSLEPEAKVKAGRRIYTSDGEDSVRSWIASME